MLIKSAAKEYLVENEVRKFTRKTITSYRNNLNVFVRYCLEVAGIETMDELTLAVVRKFTLYMVEKEKKGVISTAS